MPRGNDDKSMGPPPQDFSQHNADVLDRVLEARRRDLGSVGEDERERRELALAAIEGYAALMRESGPQASSRNPIRYCFKLVFPDGRWSVDEKQLPTAPHEGDVLAFPGYGEWRIEGSERVGVKPAGKPQREFFVCAPAA
jgi:hypothetical protein